MTNKIYDKNLRPIMVGDVLKIFHFTETLRRQRHYMFKQVISEDDETFKIVHLNMDNDDWYQITKTNTVLDDTEIVQDIDCNFDRREKTTSVKER